MAPEASRSDSPTLTSCSIAPEMAASEGRFVPM